MKEKKKSVRVRDWDWALGVKVVIHVVAFLSSRSTVEES